MSDALVIDSIRIQYSGRHGVKTVVDDFSLRLPAVTIGCLLGASGSGKTSVLRGIAGFEPLQAGQIALDGVALCTAHRSLAPEHRRVGMMFQDYALFPHLNVAANVAFGLRAMASEARKHRVKELLEWVGLRDSSDAFVHELSGGQQQRVALARALAPQPALLLLDEPFSNLDIDTRERLAFELRDLLYQAGATALLVTHNQAEAFAIADTIGIMHGGKLAQWDTPHGLNHYPANDYVSQFLKHEASMVERRAQALRRGGAG